MEKSADDQLELAAGSSDPSLSGIPPEAVKELRRIVFQAIKKAVADHREGVRDTLRLCVAAFDEASTLENTPRSFRVLVRVCQALCLDGLGEGDEEEAAEFADLTCGMLPR